MSRLPLDTRQARIARALLVGDGTLSLDALAAELGLTRRIIRYNLAPVEGHLAEHDLRLTRRRGVGLWLEGGPEARAAALATLDEGHGPAVLDAADRQVRVILALLLAAPESLRSERLEAELAVSRATIRRDVRAAEGWFEGHRLHLRRLPGVGLAVRGSEIEVRAALLGLLLETVPEHVLVAMLSGIAPTRPGIDGPQGVPPSLAAYLADLELGLAGDVLATEIPEIEPGDATIVTAAISLAILVARVRAGRPARLGRGRLRSLMDHPVSAAARRIAHSIATRLGIALPSAEVAAITESLLGFAELGAADAGVDESLVGLVDRLVERAAQRLHPALAEDALLRESLAEHVHRLDVRLRYGLPVTNPLQQEVRRRYPDIYEIAAGIVGEVDEGGGLQIPAEEVGFLTMYLAGSLERLRLRPKVRVTVVCPAGMATAWILVSRLLAEFPQLEIAQVVSKTAFEGGEPGAETDLVVSTVPLEGLTGVPSLVVSPLLAERDIRRLARHLETAPGR
ncbi:MAG: PRD domain-containing protein [Chloroflexota bacterium]